MQQSHLGTYVWTMLVLVFVRIDRITKKTKRSKMMMPEIEQCSKTHMISFVSFLASRQFPHQYGVAIHVTFVINFHPWLFPFLRRKVSRCAINVSCFSGVRWRVLLPARQTKVWNLKTSHACHSYLCNKYYEHSCKRSDVRRLTNCKESRRVTQQSLKWCWTVLLLSQTHCQSI